MLRAPGSAQSSTTSCADTWRPRLATGQVWWQTFMSMFIVRRFFSIRDRDLIECQKPQSRGLGRVSGHERRILFRRRFIQAWTFHIQVEPNLRSDAEGYWKRPGPRSSARRLGEVTRRIQRRGPSEIQGPYRSLGKEAALQGHRAS